MAGCLAWVFASPHISGLAVVAISYVQGVGVAGSLTFRQSMFVDTIEYDRRMSGLRREGALTGAFNLVDKVFSALGLTLVGFILAGAGYLASRGGHVSHQPASAILAIRLLFGLTPALASGLGILLLTRYDLTEKRLRAMPTVIHSA